MGLLKINMLALARIRIFTLRDLWLFLIGIMFVSMTSGAIGAFITGVSEEEFFIGGADNILIVSQPGITTPLTGRVPEYLQADIQKVKGVLAISAETMCVSVAQNLDDQSIIVRGITPNFTQITPISLLDGSWFDPTFGQATDIRVNGAMVGYLLAEGLGLSCGDELQLASTLTDVVVEVVITGIIRSDSPTDEELLVSLPLGKNMIGKGSTFVSFIRVLVDEETITKEKLSELLNEEFTVPILLSSQDPELVTTLIGTPIVAYTPNGAHVETKFIQNDNKTEFQLKFGSYEFVALPSGTQNSPPISVFVNQSFIDPLEIRIGRSYYDLHLNITYNEQPAENASVFLQKKFHFNENQSSQTDTEGLVKFLGISEDFYDIFIQYRGIENKTTIRLTESMLLDVELENSLSLTVLNVSSGQEVHGGTIQILNNSQITNYKSSTPIYLDPGEYKFEFQINDTFREFSSVINGTESHTIYVGIASFIVWTRGENKTLLDSNNVTITRFNEIIAQDITNVSGACEFQLEVGLDYDVTAILAENQSKIQTWGISFKNTSSLIIDFLDVYVLDIVVFNGTSPSSSDNGLANCDIIILKNSSLLTSGRTNSSGKVTFQLSEPGLYQVNVTKDGFQNIKTLGIFQKNRTCLFSLGNVYLSVLTQSIGGHPIFGAVVSLKNETNVIFSGNTNSSGLVELFFPLGLYILHISKGSYTYQEVILFTESQRISLVKIIELTGDLNIILNNQFSQKITKANVVLNNDIYGIEFSGFTNDKGEITFYTIPWANYSVNIVYSDEFFPTIDIDFAEEEQSFSLQVETIYPILNIEEYALRTDRGFSVVLSSQFMSSFLQTTLAIILTTLTSLVIIISVLSLLSITSVISQPIVSNERALETFKRLGATRNQVTLGVVLHLSLLGLLASILGSLLGMGVMTVFPELKNVNVGGIIIRPKMEFWLLILIILSNLGVIILKASQKVRQLHTLY